MKKSSIILIAVITILVLEAGYYSYLRWFKPAVQPHPQPTVQITKPVNCDEISDLEKKNECLGNFNESMNEVMNRNDSSACGQLVDESDQKACEDSYVVKEVAENKDFEQCNNLKDEAGKQNCVSQASFSIAIQEKDISYCENIQNDQDKESCKNIVESLPE